MHAKMAYYPMFQRLSKFHNSTPAVARSKRSRSNSNFTHTDTHRETHIEKNIFKKLFFKYISIVLSSSLPTCVPQFDQFDRDQFDRDRRRVLSMEPKSTLTADTIRSLLEARHADGRNKSSAPGNDRNGSQNRKNPFAPNLHLLATGAISRHGCTTCHELVQSHGEAALLAPIWCNLARRLHSSGPCSTSPTARQDFPYARQTFLHARKHFHGP